MTDIEFVWSHDPEIDSSDHSDEKPAYPLWLCVAYRAESDEIVDTLGGCDFGRDGSPWAEGSEGYRAECEAMIFRSIAADES